jgi:tyrosine-protein phosphatase SIW14
MPALQDASQETQSIAPRPVARRRFVFVVGAMLPLVCVAGYFGFYRYHLKRLQAVAPGVLYRVGQPTELGFRVLNKFYGARTVLSLQLFDFRLKSGLFDFGESDGRKEAEFVESLGMRHVQWAMGDEKCWPWPEPWQLEEFYELIDDPRNHPIVVHCMGGRHRTGTISALYRMEYDRWSAADALREMYTFSFGGAVPVQEHNLLTYVPRPEPTVEQWRSLQAAFARHFPQMSIDSYRTLVRSLKASQSTEVSAIVQSYVADNKPFALPLAMRLIDGPQHPLAESATRVARRFLAEQPQSPRDDEASVIAAVALIADYGSPQEQQFLADIVRDLAEANAPATPFYEAVVRGLTSRFTRNRLAFLRPLVDDVRPRIDPAMARYRYCDSLLYFITSVTDEIPCMMWSPDVARQQGPQAVRRWYAENPAAAQLAQRTPPPRNYGVLAGDGPVEEDLSKMRR